MLDFKNIVKRNSCWHGRPSYVFGGWYKDAAYGNDWDFDSDTVSDDTILYAKWTTDTALAITTTSLQGGTVGA